MALEIVNYSKTAYDVGSFITDKPSTTDMVLSAMTDKKCRVKNLIYDQDICREKTATERMWEYILENLEELNIIALDIEKEMRYT